MQFARSAGQRSEIRWYRVAAGAAAGAELGAAGRVAGALVAAALVLARSGRQVGRSRGRGFTSVVASVAVLLSLSGCLVNISLDPRLGEACPYFDTLNQLLHASALRSVLQSLHRLCALLDSKDHRNRSSPNGGNHALLTTSPSGQATRHGVRTLKDG